MPEAPSHDALEMMHVRERAQMFQERHMDTAELANFPKVVPLKVDDYHVLGGVLLAREGFAGEAFVLDRRLTAGPRALDRTGLDLGAADSEEPFGARRQQAVVARLEERSKGPWVRVRRRSYAAAGVPRNGSATRWERLTWKISP